IYRQPKAFEASQTWQSNNKTNTLYIYRNQVTGFDSSSLGQYDTNNIQSFNVNRDGTYDYNVLITDSGGGSIPKVDGKDGWSTRVYLYDYNR
ncbi:MAG: hypothetical protein GWN13_17225, partial [Phycisphaerae bacterium]|nr:hypothetical protein [Phycisphaerae bacterium]NIW99957.1 hypothetical protein [Phycisphaerae bacterium]